MLIDRGRTEASRPDTIVLSLARRLTLEGLVAVARQGATVAIGEDARRAIALSRAALEALVDRQGVLYGLTTGVGALDAVAVGEADRPALQRSLLRSHAAGVGPPMARDQVRAMMLSRLHVLTAGMSGASWPLVETLMAMLDRDVTPVVPSGGSVGASDLAPLAHVGLVLIGEGRAQLGDETLPGGLAMAQAGIVLPALSGRDALALINGLDQTSAIGGLALHDAEILLAWAEAAAALTIAGARGRDDFLAERLVRAKPHPGTVASARRIRALLGGRKHRPRPEAALREPLSSRYAPHVLGAAREAIGRARDALQIEINSVVDNPVIGPDGWSCSNSGNSSGQVMADVLDALASSLISVAVASERSTARLLDPAHNAGLPAFLVHPAARPGISSGLMVAQYTAASLVAELRTRAVPAGLQSIPTSRGTEDHVAMSALSARRAAWVVETVRVVVSIQLLAATQAADLMGERLPGPLAEVKSAVRAVAPIMIEDRIIAEDLEAVTALLARTVAP